MLSSSKGYEIAGFPLWLGKAEKGLFFHFGLEQLEKHILLIKMLVGKAGNFFQEYIFFICSQVN